MKNMNTKIDTLGRLFNDDELIGNVHIRKELWQKPKQKIYHYLQVKHLFALLENKSLFVNNRVLFSDIREQGKMEDLKYCSDIILPFAHNKRERKSNEDMLNYLSALKEIAFKSCISCWTKGVQYSKGCDEDILEWDHYCTGKAQYGETCRIETTVEQLVNTIQSNSVSMWLSEVQYDKETMRTTSEKWIFWKYEGYKFEQEVRLCIDTTKDNICLTISPENLINSVRLSPYINKSDCQYIIAKLTQCSFLKDKVHPSHLLEKPSRF